jgi:UDP-glucose:(heptosyl)LPS alpha-1,3-glucosyltransferase
VCAPADARSQKPGPPPGDSRPRPADACDVTIVAGDIGPVGGMERALAELVSGLRELGHGVTVIARTCELPTGVEVAFHHIRAPARPALLAQPWFVLAASLALARRRRGLVQATGAVVLNRVDVIAVHYCHQVGPANPSRSTLLFQAHSKAVTLLKRFTERWCFHANSSAAFVCVSEGCAREVREHYTELAERVSVIHNGVDADVYAPGRYRDGARELRAKLKIPDRRLVALFVGSGWRRKGLGELIEALAPARAWDLVVAGHGDRERYQRLADSLGVGERVHWLGVTRDVAHAYALADAYVLPSSYETFSLATFEAAASGLPILVTPESGVEELIEDGQNGIAITRDPEIIAGGLEQLAADPALRSRLGAAARRSALDFTWRRMVGGYHELYQSVLGPPPA